MSAVSGPRGNTGNNSRAVPQPKPRYAPEGWHRCDVCNRLVRDGCACKCRDDGYGQGELKVTHVDPETLRRASAPRRDHGMEHAVSEVAKVSMGLIGKHSTRPRDVDPPRVADGRRIATCRVCGRQFEAARTGRPPTMCHECRKLPPWKRGVR